MSAEHLAAQTCEFGCGPDLDESYVRPGFNIVPACPVHGWIVDLLNERSSGREGGRQEYETEEVPRRVPSRTGWRRWLRV